MSEFQILTVRKLADREGQTRVRKYDEETGQPKLVNPATPGEDHEPWPLLGVTVVDPPQRTSAGVNWVNQAVSEGWMRRIGERPVARPGGPFHAPWATVHTFIHADRLEIDDHLTGETVSYKVIQQPDKYWSNGEPVEEYAFGDDTELATTEVKHFYLLELDNG